MGPVQAAGETRCIRILEEKQSVRVGGAGANVGPVGQVRGGQNTEAGIGGRRQLELESSFVPKPSEVRTGGVGGGGTTL